MNQSSLVKPVLMIGLLLVPFASAFADTDPNFNIADECKPQATEFEFVHSAEAMKYPVDDSKPIFPGDNVAVIASFHNPLDPALQTEEITQVRFVWKLPDGTLVRETVVPVDTATTSTAEDILFNIPDDPDFVGSAVFVWVCYEDTSRTRAAATTHFDVTSFFVLPESPIGAVAMAAASFGVVAGFLYFRMNKAIPDRHL